MSGKFVAMLAGIGALGTVAIHMVVPALPVMASELGADPSEMQLAITFYLIGLGLGQLGAGPASDSIGRRPVLQVGLAMFFVGGLVCAFSTHAWVLLVARIVQAVGGAAALVTARAIVSDLADESEIASRMALLMGILFVSPAVAPVIGAVIVGWSGWRAVFFVLAAAAALGAFAAALFIGETRRTASEPQSFVLTRAYVRLFGNRQFIRIAVSLACCSCAMYVFLAGSAFLLVERYGLSPEAVGLCYFFIAVSGIVGAIAVGSLERYRIAWNTGLSCVCGGGALMLVLVGIGSDSPTTLVAPMMLTAFGGGIAAPTGMATVMRVEEGLSATAASLAGAMQMVGSGLATSVIMQVRPDTLITFAATIFLCAAVALAIGRGAGARKRDRAQ